MRTFIADIFPKIQRFSQKLDSLTLLTNQHWVSIDNILSCKTVYIFRSNNELLVSTNGKVEKAKWEYIGKNSLLIDKANESYLFAHGFLDENVLALKLDSSKEYAVFVNETKHVGDLNSLNKVSEFLKNKYLNQSLITDIKIIAGKKNEAKNKPNTIHIRSQKEIEDEIQESEIMSNKFNKIFGILILIVIIFLLSLYFSNS